MATSYDVGRYSVSFFSSPSEASAGMVANISLDDATRGRAALAFYAAGFALPPASVDAGGTIWMHFSEAQLPVILEFLRRDRPVCVRFDSGVATLSCKGYEPIGDEDTSANPR